MFFTLLILAGSLIWLFILLAPWRPWGNGESLEARPLGHEADLSDITAVIPARNEASLIETILSGLRKQGLHLNVILVDDQSTDGTAAAARRAGLPNLQIIEGQPPPGGWSGKLWALDQGFRHVNTPLVLLMDADIELGPGILSAARERMSQRGCQLVSLMASLRMVGFWEQLLMPAFVYFFKLVYPFRLANSRRSRIAAAAGGFILLETRLLREMGGFEELRGELIDDCALAKKIKFSGHTTWVGLSHGVRSIRPYDGLGAIWEMVARTAFTQLRYSALRLGLCTSVLLLAFWGPAIGVGFGSGLSRLGAIPGLAAMILSYLPTLGFFRLSKLWVLTMPLIGSLYLGMTWTSAIRYYQGQRSQWKGRVYSRSGIAGGSILRGTSSVSIRSPSKRLSASRHADPLPDHEAKPMGGV
jgi:hopene-associated glycosyltransferase HpnB